MGVTTGGTQEGTGTQSPSPNELSENELFEMLANQRRRHVLHALMQDETPLEIGPLSQEIAAWEDGLEYDQVSSADRKRVYTALQQSHLPKMDRAGVVEYDADRGTVEPTPALEEIEVYIDVVRGRDIPWSHYYLLLAAIGGGLLGATSVGVGPLAGVSASAVSIFVVVAIGVSAVCHWYHARSHRLGIDGAPPEQTKGTP